MPRGADGQSGIAQIAESLTAEGLLTLDLAGRPRARLAERWSQSPDGLTWTFALRSNAQFQNGEPADAKSVAALFDEARKTAYARRFYTQLSDVTSVETPDHYTLRIRTSRPRALLPDDVADLRLGGARDPEKALGAFIIEKSDDDELVLRAFPSHFLGPAGVQRVRFRSYRTLRSALTAMMRGEIDALYEVNRDALEFVAAESKVRIHRFLRPYVANLLFNVRRPQLRDGRIRRALSAAINRDAIVEQAYRGAGRRADGPLWPNHWALARDVARVSYDPAAALAILANLKEPARPDAGKMPARLRFTCLVPTIETQPMERIALLLQKQLYEFGVDMELEPVSPGEAISRAFTGRFDTILLEFAALTPGWLYPMWHSAAPHEQFAIQNGYSAADRELEGLKNAATNEEIRNAIAAVYRKMYEDPPAIFIAWPEVVRAVSIDFDVPIKSGADPMGSNLRLWRPKRPQDTAP